jgi:competence protein ComEC
VNEQLPQNPVQVEVLWPPNDLPEDIKVNDTSLVIKLTYGGYSILLTGDIGEYAQERLLESGADLSADVLLLPHHGSVVPNTVRFLQAVGARYLVRSSASRRRGIPDPIDSILRGSEYFNTADVGAITITLRERVLRVAGLRSSDSNYARASAP